MFTAFDSVPALREPPHPQPIGWGQPPPPASGAPPHHPPTAGAGVQGKILLWITCTLLLLASLASKWVAFGLPGKLILLRHKEARATWKPGNLRAFMDGTLFYFKPDFNNWCCIDFGPPISWTKLRFIVPRSGLHMTHLGYLISRVYINSAYYSFAINFLDSSTLHSLILPYIFDTIVDIEYAKPQK